MGDKKNIKYEGLGFPVILMGVRTKVTKWGDVKDINYEALQRSVFDALVRKPARLAGAELKFIRHYLGFTQNVMADAIGVERSSIAKWESTGLKQTKMPGAVELVIRFHMVRKLQRSIDTEFALIEPIIRRKVVGEPVEVSVA